MYNYGNLSAGNFRRLIMKFPIMSDIIGKLTEILTL